MMADTEENKSLKRVREWVYSFNSPTRPDDNCPNPSTDPQITTYVPSRKLPTPPESHNSMGSGSPKRLRTDDLNDDTGIFATPRSANSPLNADPDQTPKSSLSYDVSLSTSRPVLRPRSTTSSQYSQTSTRRSNSPPKRIQSLGVLQKPVKYVALQDDPRAQLPQDVQSLWNRIYEITVERVGFLPPDVEEEIHKATGRPIREHWLIQPELDQADGGHAAKEKGAPLTRWDAQTELVALQKIELKAQDSMLLGRTEAGWNVEVHGPVIDLALLRHSHVVKEYVPGTQIAPKFVPPTEGRGQAVSGKMVDFVLALAPDDRQSSAPDTELASLISRVVRAQETEQYINQTQYPALQFRPISVTIETKTSGSPEEGMVQLGVWSAAWHRRMRAILHSDTARSTDDERRIITLPLLLVVGHEWKLLFACDRGDHIDIVHDMSVGDTKSIIGLYTVMAVLAELAKWSTSVFRGWMVDVLTSIDPELPIKSVHAAAGWSK